MTARRSGERSSIDYMYPYDLAISAVPYDAALVAELISHVGFRLRAPTIWEMDAPVHDIAGDAAVVPALSADRSRVAVVLHQRLWLQDDVTRLDEIALRSRLERRAGSIRVVTLDEERLPAWLAKAPRCDLTADGITGVAEFLLAAVSESGGVVASVPSVPTDTAAAPERAWREGPAPFVGQPRAFSSLRRELDALALALKPSTPGSKSEAADPTIELNVLPNRIVLRLHDVGISFSWVAGRMGTVADGRLLVMQWEGATPHTRGVGALRFARPVRELVYRVESDGPERWWWRVDQPNGRASTTVNLAGEWLAAATMARPEGDLTRAS
jgi:hypothetical protein